MSRLLVLEFSHKVVINFSTIFFGLVFFLVWVCVFHQPDVGAVLSFS